VTARVKKYRKQKRRKIELIRQESKVGHGLTFVNPDATRDGEDPVWRLLGPGSDSELIRTRCVWELLIRPC
jgi:hypothetical protein